METFTGKSVFEGVVIGKIRLYQKDEQHIVCHSITDPEAEKRRYEEAVSTATLELKRLYEHACKDISSTTAGVFLAHQLMLVDEEFTGAVYRIIEEEAVNAEYAIKLTRERYYEVFEKLDNDYLQRRAADLKDVTDRLLTVLTKEQDDSFEMTEPVILLANDLLPSDTVKMEKDKILSFVTVQGSLNSHAAILARSMGIPSLVKTKMVLSRQYDGALGIVDGLNGRIIINPDEATLYTMKRIQEETNRIRRLLEKYKGKEAVTREGKKIPIYANIGNMEALEAAINNDAEGVGLFRSEMVYLSRDTYPTEEEQFEIYRSVLQKMQGKRVMIRTLDIGSDKQCDYFGILPETNPALGYRAIRICLSKPEIFKTQIRALYRASQYGKLAIAYPMIANLWEIWKIKEICAQVEEELMAEGLAFQKPEQGIIIETPAAVMISDELAREVDFFSIGTNDLLQYTLALDRQNSKLDQFYDAHHPALLRMISMVVKAAHQNGITVGICGELGSDLTLTNQLVKLGIDDFSVAAERILPLRQMIIDHEKKMTCKD